MYYLIEVTDYVDGTPQARGVYGYETELEATAKFHKKLGGAMDNENYAREMVIVTDDKSNVIQNDVFVRPPKVEPEPEVVEGE